MSQRGYPDEDEYTGGWGPLPLWARLDEPEADDADYVTSPALPPPATFVVRVEPLAPPIAGRVEYEACPHTLTVRLDGTACASAVVALVEEGADGDRWIKSESFELEPGFRDYTLTLSYEEAVRIEDHAALKLLVMAAGSASCSSSSSAGSGSESGSDSGSGSGSGSGSASSSGSGSTAVSGSNSTGTSGSGSGTGGYGPCEVPSDTVNAVVTGPFGPGDREVTLPVELSPDAGWYTSAPVTADGATMTPRMRYERSPERWVFEAVVEPAAGGQKVISATLTQGPDPGELSATAEDGAVAISADDPCNNPPGATCDVCSPKPLHVTLTLEAGGGGWCNCDYDAGTFVLTRSGDNCDWYGVGLQCGQPYFVSFQLYKGVNEGPVWRVITAWGNGYDAATWDCTSPLVLTKMSESPICSTPETVTIRVAT